PGVLCVVPGPGVTNALTGLGEALLECARAHARLAVWLRRDLPWEFAQQPTRVPLSAAAEAPLLQARAGVFSWRHLDAGTRLLQATLSTVADAPKLIADFGAGVGHLALQALIRWPQAHAHALEADAQALACLRSNARELGLQQRCQAWWWDVSEPAPAECYDLILCNPPCHESHRAGQGFAVAHAMLRQAARSLHPDGTLLLVANRQLPYEAVLHTAFAGVEQLRQEQGFKVVAARRPREVGSI
ncbi:MAG: methyltransferase, partial [Planctomycetota bacterium]